MKAAVLEKAGVPLLVENIREPKPRQGEVLVKVAACGVCHTDLHVMKGEVAFPTPPTPMTATDSPGARSA